MTENAHVHVGKEEGTERTSDSQRAKKKLRERHYIAYGIRFFSIVKLSPGRWSPNPNIP